MSSRRTPVMLRATACLGAVAAIGASAWRAAPWDALQQPASTSAGSALVELGDRSAGLDRSSLASTKKTRTTLVSAHSNSRVSGMASGAAGSTPKASSVTEGAAAAAAGLPGDAPVDGTVGGGVVDAGGAGGSVPGGDPSSIPAAPTQAPVPGQPVYVLLDQAAPNSGEGSQGAKAATSAAPTVHPTTPSTSAPTTSSAPGRSSSQDESERSSAPTSTRSSRPATTKSTTAAATTKAATTKAPIPSPRPTDS